MPTQTHQIHVSDMVRAIVKTGISEPELARQCGCAQSTINRIGRRAVDCRYSLYEQIAAIYRQRCGSHNQHGSRPAA